MRKPWRTQKSMLSIMLVAILMFSFAGIVSAEEKQVTTITLYPNNGSLTSGKVGGWLGDFFAENGLAIEVWAYSADKTNAILASGDLPDIMYLDSKIYETAINAGMLLCLDEYIDTLPNIAKSEVLPTAFNYIRAYRSANTGKLWFMPLNAGVSDGSGDETERYALRLNWAFYEGIGRPQFDSIWDAIPVVKQMLEQYPYGNPDGTNQDKNYGTVLNSGSDGSYWGNIVMPYNWSGYDYGQLSYLVEGDMVNGTYATILTKDSLYYDSLRWYNAMYREGLLDPDSINLDRPTQKAKVDSGNVMLPSGTNPGWRPIYYQYLLKDNDIYYKDYNAYGGIGVAINAKTKNIDACLKYLDVIASPENELIHRQGPEGEKWYRDENGYVHVSDRFIDATLNNQEFLFSDGTKYTMWNCSWIASFGNPTSYTDVNGNPISPNMNSWKEFQEINANSDLALRWREANGGHLTFVDWANAEGKLYTKSELADIGQFLNKPDDMMKLTMDAIRDVVVNASWQMVYAESDDDFNTIWERMVEDCDGLGAQDIIEWRLADLYNAKAMKADLER